MAESNATQVILTDDGLKIIKAQATADSAASQAENANSALSIAQSTANAARSAADSTYAYANSEMAVNSMATAKAQSTADTAFSQAQTVFSQADSEIAVNSMATAKAQSTADNAFSQATTAIDNNQVTSQAVTSLKDGSTMTIAELQNGLATKVANSDYASYKDQTASQIGQMVTNGAFSAYQTQTANLIASKVATKDFSAYQATTAKSIDSKVESKDFNSYKEQTDKAITSKVSNSEYASDKEQTASEVANMVSNSAFSTYQDQTASQISQLVTNGAFSAYSQATATLISSKVATSDFSSYKDQTATAIDSKVASSAFDSYKEQTASAISSKVSTADFSTYKTQTANDINLRVATKDLISQINIQAHNTLISSGGQLTLSGKTIYFDTANPVIIPSANITDTLNGKTINGTTINGGDIINDANNTSNFYPFTVEATGKASTTAFTSMDALRTEMDGGGIVTKFRATNSTGTKYEAYDGYFDGNTISLNSGFTNGKDMSFTQSITGSQLTGQVLISPLDGLTLHGDTQQITFNGTSADVTPKGIIITPYGNINPNGTQNIWYVGNNMNMKTASFGIDGSGANNIQFNRSLDIGNLNINTYHTFTSTDGAPIHFAKGPGGAADIYAGTVHYDSLVKSSLLSVKWDVQKADTAYWAQLVNSIDLATYQYKTDDNTSHLRLSSIVDDVNDTKQWQLPDVFISRDENGKLNGVDDSVLLNATLATVQEQQKEIDQLNGHNMELEARLNKLEAKLNG